MLNNNIPWVYCDFNSCTEKNEYWTLKKDDLVKIDNKDNKKIFIFMYENEEETEIVGCEAILKKSEGKWIAIPNDDTWYSGKK